LSALTDHFTLKFQFSQKFRRGNTADDRQRASSASVVLHRDRARGSIAALARPQRHHDSEVMPTRQPYKFSIGGGRRSDVVMDQVRVKKLFIWAQSIKIFRHLFMCLTPLTSQRKVPK
jgi:hypothetical protein